MTVKFSREQFEQALPVVNGTPLWKGLGLVKREFVYVLQVRPGVLIYIRSSIQPNGFAADKAQDSIRCWLAADETGKPLGTKDQRWITRVPGWEKRLIELLRKLWRRGNKLAPCLKCQSQTIAVKSKKPGANLGRWYVCCTNCSNFVTWLEDENGKPKAA